MTIELQSRQRINPWPARFAYRARPVNVGDGIDDIRWIRALGGERLPAASYALLPNPPKGQFFAIGDGSRNFVVSFLPTRGQMFLHQTPGRRPARITCRVVNTAVTRGWVGAANERAPFRTHDAAVGFVDRCLSGLGISPLRIKYLAEFFLRPILAQHLPRIIFSGFLESLKRKKKKKKKVLTASGTEILCRVSLTFELFFATSCFHCHRSI